MDRTKGKITLAKENIKFSSKAKTLEDLSRVLKGTKILPLFRFKVRQFSNNKLKIVKNIQENFKEELLIVRSSGKQEDSTTQSNAGKFASILNVPNSADKLITAITKVSQSFDKQNRNHEIFVQPMLTSIKMSGVAFTTDLDSLSPYYIINYDESYRSDTVTSGQSGNLKTYIHYRKSPFKCNNKNLRSLLKVCKIIEKIFNNNYLDIEFAFDHKDTLYILQVRPIISKFKEDLSEISLSEPLKNIYKKIQKLSSPHPNLLGSKTLFGVMPDWNPAEIIGYKPKQLSTSLYKEIITDNIWAYQRDNYGYRNLRSHPLMVTFLGIPYIDVRVDFNSFIPKDLDEKISEKLIEYYLNKLTSEPHLHDKIEFEIVHSCFYFNLPAKLKQLQKYGFNKKEIRQILISLRRLTNKIINPKNGLFKEDLRKIEILESRYKKICSSQIPLVDKIYWLIEDCKRYGTLPFAGIARAAFIATQILKSLVELNIITEKKYNLFINSLNTITKKISNHLYKLSLKEVSTKEFLELYGHLRPGTYDISSLRYDENFGNYFSLQKAQHTSIKKFSFSKKEKDHITKMLVNNRIKITTNELISFIRESIEQREYAKYIFTKSVSKILQLIEQLGKRCRINRNNLAFVDIKTIMHFYSTLDHRNMGQILREDIKKYKTSHIFTKTAKLPSLIINPEDVYGFFQSIEEPNFITLKRVSSKISYEEIFQTDKLEGKIVFIKSADPGYDFLFTKNIGGLITQYGGANSHMAIRCAELGIPAVIGCGDKNFNQWIKAKVLEVDCLNKQVKIIQ